MHDIQLRYSSHNGQRVMW